MTDSVAVHFTCRVVARLEMKKMSLSSQILTLRKKFLIARTLFLLSSLHLGKNIINVILFVH